MTIGSLDSLKRHKKCMRVSTARIYRAAMKGAKNKTKAKRAEVKAAASAVARVACAVNVGSRRQSKKRSLMTYGGRQKARKARASRRVRAREPQTGAERMPGPYAPEPRPFPYDDNWGY